MPTNHLILEDCESRDNTLLHNACDSLDIDVIFADRHSLDGIPENCPIDGTALSGGWTFCRRVARSLGGRVLEPADDFLPSLPFRFVNRRIATTTLAAARGSAEPQFVKPVKDKPFPAGVYDRGTDILAADADGDMLVLTSEPVVWEIEYRLFVLDREIVAVSPYRWTEGDYPGKEMEQEARRFGALVLGHAAVTVPRAVVLDVGRIAGTGWSVVEANAAAMSGIYDCDPVRVLQVLEAGLVADS